MFWFKKKKSKWKRITEGTRFPYDKTFILFDDKFTSGLGIYEAMVFEDGNLGCPATLELFDPKDFSHWRPMIKLPKSRVKSGV